MDKPLQEGRLGRQLIQQAHKRKARGLAQRAKLKGMFSTGGQGVVSKVGGGTIGQNAGALRAGVKMLKAKRAEQKQRLAASQEFVQDALALAESQGWTFESKDEVLEFLDAFTEAVLDERMVGMSPIGTIKMKPQSHGLVGDKYPGMDKINPDGQRAGPKTSTRSGEDVSAKLDKKSDIDSKDFDKNQTRGPDSYPALSYARDDGQRSGPKADTRSAEEHHPVKAESLHDMIYNSLAGKRVRAHVNEGRNPSPVEIKQIAETEGFAFGDLNDVENFMKLALVEKLYPSTGPTKHANQMKGDKIPGAMGLSKDMQRLGPKDSTLGQNSKGARAAKNKGEAPHNNYKDDGPKGSTQQFEQSIRGKVCPVCNQKNGGVNAYCGACGAVLPPRPEDSDGGIPVKGTTGGKRNHNVASDGGTPNVRSPYGGGKSKHYYLKPSPKGMKEDITESAMPESSRVVLYDMLRENMVDYSPKGVHDKTLSSPSLGAVNAKAKALGLRDITQGELDNVVGLFQQGENVLKVRLYTGVEMRLTQAIANMMGIGASHGGDLGMTDHVSSANLHPGA